MYAAAWAAHTVGNHRRRLWAAHHGSAVPLAALLAFAALRSPGTTLLTVPAPPALGDLVSAASGVVSDPAGFSQYVSEHAQHYIASSLWPSWLPPLGPGARGRRSGAKTRSSSGGSGGGGGGGSSNVSGSRPGARAGPHGRRQPQAGSRLSRQTGGIGGGGSLGSRDPSAAARPWAGPGAAALLPLRLGARQLLAAMATPPLLSLVSWVPSLHHFRRRRCCRWCAGTWHPRHLWACALCKQNGVVIPFKRHAVFGWPLTLCCCDITSAM